MQNVEIFNVLINVPSFSGNSLIKARRFSVIKNFGLETGDAEGGGCAL